MFLSELRFDPRFFCSPFISLITSRFSFPGFVNLVARFFPVRKNKADGNQMDGNTTQMDGKATMQTFQKSFGQVQNILDQNRLLINEINQNQETKMPDNLSRNIGLIKELNNNIRRVVDLYADLSTSVTKSMDVSSEGDSNGRFRTDGKAGQKRIRP